MYNANIPTDRELPSTRKLVKSTVAAAGVAAILLVGVVMPAEYGIDPTGIGEFTGLRKMGELKLSLAREAEEERLAEEQFEIAMRQRPASPEEQQAAAQAIFGADTPSAASAPVAPPAVAEPAPDPARRRDQTTIALQPDEANEVELELKKGDVVEYVWTSSAGTASFDVHADSTASGIEYHSHAKGASTREEGTLRAAFDGAHGWSWRNRSGAPLTITLDTTGPYTAIRRER